MKVVISEGYGDGWSTWSGCPELATDPAIVEAVENDVTIDEMEKLVESLGYPSDQVKFCMTYGNLVVVDVPPGKYFRIKEYDGYESVEILDKKDWTLSV